MRYANEYSNGYYTFRSDSLAKATLAFEKSVSQIYREEAQRRIQERIRKKQEETFHGRYHSENRRRDPRRTQ